MDSSSPPLAPPTLVKGASYWFGTGSSTNGCVERAQRPIVEEVEDTPRNVEFEKDSVPFAIGDSVFARFGKHRQWYQGMIVGFGRYDKKNSSSHLVDVKWTEDGTVTKYIPRRDVKKVKRIHFQCECARGSNRWGFCVNTKYTAGEDDLQPTFNVQENNGLHASNHESFFAFAYFNKEGRSKMSRKLRPVLVTKRFEKCNAYEVVWYGPPSSTRQGTYRDTNSWMEPLRRLNLMNFGSSVECVRCGTLRPEGMTLKPHQQFVFCTSCGGVVFRDEHGALSLSTNLSSRHHNELRKFRAVTTPTFVQYSSSTVLPSSAVPLPSRFYYPNSISIVPGSDIVLPPHLLYSKHGFFRKYSVREVERLRRLASRYDLHDAVRAQNFELVHYFVCTLGVSPNTFDAFGRTAVYEAARIRDGAFILYFLLTLGGADLNGACYASADSNSRNVFKAVLRRLGRKYYEKIGPMGETCEMARRRVDCASSQGFIDDRLTRQLLWSRHTHRMMPNVFKRSVRALLLCKANAIGYPWLWIRILSFTTSRWFSVKAGDMNIEDPWILHSRKGVSAKMVGGPMFM